MATRRPLVSPQGQIFPCLWPAGLSITSCGQSQASAFDECSLNVSQFVQLTETFLNERPPKDLFELLTKYLKEQYVETEEEKLKRLVKVGRGHFSKLVYPISFKM